MKRRMTLLAVLAIVSSPVLAEGIPVEPGMWEVTTTMTMPMMPTPQVMTVEECFKDDIMDMDDMSTDDLDPNCVFDLLDETRFCGERRPKTSQLRTIAESPGARSAVCHPGKLS